MTGSLRAIVAGALTTVQDLGRPGFAHLGVPLSGALDPDALRLANRLVGNPVDAAGLEITMTGCTLRSDRPATVALTGALAVITIDGRHAGHAVPLSLRAGATIIVGPALRGVRSYFAVAGGVAVPPVLGSRSTDTLSGLGPAPVRDGDTLPIGTPTGTAPAGVDFVPSRFAAGPVVVRLSFGPRDDLFEPDARVRLLSGYTLGMSGNRVGARLIGAALPRADRRELPSEGIVLGAVQVTSDGQPLVFLADHPTTGGYPVIAVVERDDLALLAQARPGDVVLFRAGGDRGSQR